jgi:hypothetical protein
MNDDDAAINKVLDNLKRVFDKANDEIRAIVAEAKGQGSIDCKKKVGDRVIGTFKGEDLCGFITEINFGEAHVVGSHVDFTCYETRLTKRPIRVGDVIRINGTKAVGLLGFDPNKNYLIVDTNGKVLTTHDGVSIEDGPWVQLMRVVLCN